MVLWLAKTEVDTNIGKIKQCANAWGDLSETIGGLILQKELFLSNLLKRLTFLVKGFGAIHLDAFKNAKAMYEIGLRT